MNNSNNHNENKPIYISVAVAIVLVAIMLVSFHLIVRKEYRPIYSEFDTKLNIEMVKNDTLLVEKSMALTEYIHREDSLMNRVAEIQKSYQHDIDLMIYKTNQWLSFWLATIGIVVGFLSVLNIYSKYRFQDDFEALKSDNKESVGEIGERIDQQLKEESNRIDSRLKDSMNSCVADLKNRISEQETAIITNHKTHIGNVNEIEKIINRTRNENNIITLVASISSFPDPQMFQSSSDKKYHIAFFMKEMLRQVEQYLREIEPDVEEGKYDLNTLIVMLVDIKIAVCRCHPVYSLYHQNVVFSKFKQEIDSLTNDLIRGNISHRDLMDKLDPVVKGLKELTNSIM